MKYDTMSYSAMKATPFQGLMDGIKCPTSLSACEMLALDTTPCGTSSCHGAPMDKTVNSCSACSACSACSGKCGEGKCSAKCGESKCDGKCGSESKCGGEKVLGDYTPTKRSLDFRIPSNAVLGTTTQALPAKYEGTVGVAVNGVLLVGHHVDALGGEEGEMTMTFDNCGGHGGKDHKYHYHVPPLCLLVSLGGEVPKRSDWWLAKHPEAQWPKVTSKQSPIIGWAVDGFPIFGPYDPETKEMHVSQGAGCSSKLDECNGKLLSNGQYAYFITATYPYVPKCLKGSRLGTFSEGAADDTYANKCVMTGYAPMNKKTTSLCETLPQSLYLPVVESAKWTATTVLAGVLNLLLVASVAVVGNPSKIASALGVPTSKTLPLTGVQNACMTLFWSIILMGLTRAMFLLVDPYHMRDLYPNILSELLYGVLYPLVNLAAVAMMYLISPLPSYPKVYMAALAIVFAQFLVQAIMDGLRAYGKQPSWHWICQIFYTVWGILVLLSALYYTIQQRRWAFASAALLSFVLVMNSVILLSVFIGGPNDASYFGMLTWLRLLEVAVGYSYMWALSDYLRFPPALPASNTLKPPPSPPPAKELEEGFKTGSDTVFVSVHDVAPPQVQYGTA